MDINIQIFEESVIFEFCDFNGFSEDQEVQVVQVMFVEDIFMMEDRLYKISQLISEVGFCKEVDLFIVNDVFLNCSSYLFL